MAGATVTRRGALKGLAGILAAGVTPAMLSGCSTGEAGAVGDPGSPITFGSNYSDTATKAAFAALCAMATATTGVEIAVNTTDHNTFQNNISNYLQGTPDSLATWFAGYRMQYFAAQGLLAPLDDVWDRIGDRFSPTIGQLSKGFDGRFYMVPLYNYPWVVFYNRSVFADRGYQVPKTWDAFLGLARQMQADDLIPLAFADKDGWPALGLFDILNLRINGYEYHINLLKHAIPWTDPGVTAVFDKWRELFPFLQRGANGRIWQDAAKALENKTAGMMFQGSNQVAAVYDPKNLPDLDFFVFPEIDKKWGTDFMDAPTDGFILPSRGQNSAAAKRVMEFIGSPEAELEFLKTDQWDVGVALGKVPSTYNQLQRKSVAEIGKCKNVAQFLDRDSSPDMARVVVKAIQAFVENPTPEVVATIQKEVEAQAKFIFST